MDLISPALGIFAGGFLVGSAVAIIIASCYMATAVRRAHEQAQELIRKQVDGAAKNCVRVTLLLRGYEKVTRLTARAVESAKSIETLVLARAIALHLEDTVTKAMLEDQARDERPEPERSGDKHA